MEQQIEEVLEKLELASDKHLKLTVEQIQQLSAKLDEIQARIDKCCCDYKDQTIPKGYNNR